MKLIRSQDKLSVINTKYIFQISIEESIIEDDDGDEIEEYDIDIYFDFKEDNWTQTVASYRSRDECIRNMDRLVAFLGSSTPTGVFDMPS